MNNDEFRLSQKEIEAFIGNAQLAICENLPDESIPRVFIYKTQLIHCFRGSRLSTVELAATLLSAAWEIISKGVPPCDSSHSETFTSDGPKFSRQPGISPRSRSTISKRSG